MTKNNSLFPALIFAGTLAFGVIVNAEQSKKDAINNSIVEPREVYEASEYKPHIGLLVGTNTPEGSNRTGGEIGFDIGYQPYIPVGIGLIYSRKTFENSNYSTEDRDEVMAKGTYHFGGTIPLIRSSYIGFAAGTTSDSGVYKLISGPLIGFDIRVGQVNNTGLSLGALAKYVIYEGDSPDSTTLSGVLKFWL